MDRNKCIGKNKTLTNCEITWAKRLYKQQKFATVLLFAIKRYTTGQKFLENVFHCFSTFDLKVYA